MVRNDWGAAPIVVTLGEKTYLAEHQRRDNQVWRSYLQF
jgi:hypothetical protein